MHWEIYLKQILDRLLVNSTQILIISILGVIALKLVNTTTINILKIVLKNINDPEYEKNLKTLRHTLKSILDIIIITICSIMIIQKLGIDIGPILAAAGVVGIAVGFGSQRLVEDIISGITIISTNQIRVGDVVKIADKSGLVEKVDLRMVILRDIDGSVHFIRNGKIDTVTNMTKDYSYYLMDIGVAYKENIESVIEVIKQIDEEFRQDENFAKDILEPIEVLGLDKFDESSIIIKARIKTKPIKQWVVGRAFNLKLKKRFDELGIEIPFPHRIFYLGGTTELEVLANRVNNNTNKD